MDFLKDLLELNNVVYLTKLAEKQSLEEDEKKAPEEESSPLKLTEEVEEKK